MSCTLRPKPPYLRPLAKEPHIPVEQTETGEGSFHDEFAIPTYEQMKSARSGYAVRAGVSPAEGLSPPPQSAGGMTHSVSARPTAPTRAVRGASPVTMLPPQVGRRSDHAFHDVSALARQWLCGLVGLLILVAGFASVLVLNGGGS